MVMDAKSMPPRMWAVTMLTSAMRLSRSSMRSIQRTRYSCITWDAGRRAMPSRSAKTVYPAQQAMNQIKAMMSARGITGSAPGRASDMV